MPVLVLRDTCTLEASSRSCCPRPPERSPARAHKLQTFGERRMSGARSPHGGKAEAGVGGGRSPVSSPSPTASRSHASLQLLSEHAW